MTRKPTEIDVDLFAGGGGASEGIRMATGTAPYVAINHDAHAIRMHAANHPDTIHLQADVFEVKPRHAVGRQRVRLLWASPSCTHFSRARGGAPKSVQLRSLGWVVVDWAREVRPRVVICENVEEWLTWGPLGEDGQPDPAQAGDTWCAFVGALRELGYVVEWRTLNAADFGAPTSRKRLFMVARCDGAAIAWPKPTHGPGRALAYRTAAECIDWSLPVPSIFDRKKPLAEATQRRIAEGIRRYVLNNPRPFIVQTGHQSSDGGKVRPLEAPLSTVVTKAEHLLVAPTLIQTGYGERTGQAPRVLDIGAPLGTVVAGGAKHALVAAWMVKHFGGVVGHGLDRPIGTVTATDHHGLVTSALAPAIDRPSGGERVAAFLTKFYGEGSTSQPLDRPLDTIVTKDRFGLVQVLVDGEPHVIVDIGMRMLQPRELATAQGFGPEYKLTGTKSEQVARIGNSVSPYPAAALVRANVAAPAPVRRPRPASPLFGEMAAK
jgi:DNA (cytosine-5)-methyltransferase 1